MNHLNKDRGEGGGRGVSVVEKNGFPLYRIHTFNRKDNWVNNVIYNIQGEHRTFVAELLRTRRLNTNLRQYTLMRHVTQYLQRVRRADNEPVRIKSPVNRSYSDRLLATKGDSDHKNVSYFGMVGSGCPKLRVSYSLPLSLSLSPSPWFRRHTVCIQN